MPRTLTAPTIDNNVEFLLICLDCVDGSIRWEEVAKRQHRFKAGTYAKQHYQRLRARWADQISRLGGVGPAASPRVATDGAIKPSGRNRKKRKTTVQESTQIEDHDKTLKLPSPTPESKSEPAYQSLARPVSINANTRCGYTVDNSEHPEPEFFNEDPASTLQNTLTYIHDASTVRIAEGSLLPSPERLTFLAPELILPGANFGADILAGSTEEEAAWDRAVQRAARHSLGREGNIFEIDEKEQDSHGPGLGRGIGTGTRTGFVRSRERMDDEVWQMFDGELD